MLAAALERDAGETPRPKGSAGGDSGLSPTAITACPLDPGCRLACAKPPPGSNSTANTDSGELVGKASSGQYSSDRFQLEFGAAQNVPRSGTLQSTDLSLIELRPGEFAAEQDASPSAASSACMTWA